MRKPLSPRQLLLPLVPVYRLALLLREAGLRTHLEPVRRLCWPVVSIGNLSTGGAGKTPLTIALAKALTQRGLRVDVLSRGYGRQSQLPARVNPNGSAEDFGDEPLLIAQQTGVPVYVARHRYQAGLLAEAEAARVSQGAEQPFLIKGTGFSPYEIKGTGFSPYEKSMNASRALAPEAISAGSSRPTQAAMIHLLDDGFQHRQLHRDAEILLLDRRDWQDGLLPAGNLREPLQAARRAGVIAIPADDPNLEAELKDWGWQGPIWRLYRTMDVPAVDGPVVAFCGIARPSQFFAGLESAGLQLAVKLAFPDHHRYTAADLERLAASARQAGAATLITTEKDKIRLGKLSSAFPESLPLKTAHLQIEIEREDEAIDWLNARLKSAPAHPPL